MTIKVRAAQGEDLAEITAIYNDAMEKTTATFDTEAKTVEQQKAWLAEHGGRYPVLVAEREGVVIGWASLSRWSDRCAYAETAEDSVYVAETARGAGVGRALLGAALEAGRSAGLRTVLARVVEGNPASLSLHQAYGFETIGVMRQVGRKFGRLLDVRMLQKLY